MNARRSPFPHFRAGVYRLLAIAAVAVALALPLRQALAAVPLALEVYTADTTAGIGVTSTLIYGDHEAILVDTQFRISDAEKLADLVAAKGRHLKAILITHPHYDHFFGAAVLLQRFPGTPVYATASEIDFIHRTLADRLALVRKEFGPDNIPAEVPIPQVFPSTYFTVDGQAVEILTDLQGDVGPAPGNNIVWVPSLEAAIAGDIVFNQRHLSMGATNPASRQAWIETLRLIQRLNPRILVAGHKNSPELADNQEPLAFGIRYITDFEAAVSGSHSAADLVAAMKQKYPQIGGERTLQFGARALFPQ